MWHPARRRREPDQLFHWRKLYKQGLLEKPGRTSPKKATVPIIHVDVAGKARLSLEGGDERCLRAVLEYLLR